MTDPEKYAEYNPASLATIGSTIVNHGGSPAFSGKPTYFAGEPRHTAAGINFPDAATAMAWRADPEYRKVAVLREESTTNTTAFIVDL